MVMLNDLFPLMKQYIIIVLGETGAGKSTFINAITKTNDMKTSIAGKSCTRNCDFSSVTKNGDVFNFIDTPGLNDGNKKKEKENKLNIQKARDNYTRFSTLILLLKKTDYRLTSSLKLMLMNFMEIFPLKDFWEHVLIVRSNSIRYEGFEKDKNEMENALLESILDKEENQDLIDFMDAKHINYPKKLNHFYVESRVLDQDTLTEFDNILEACKENQPIFKDIKVKYSNEIIEKNGFKIVKKYKISTFLDFSDDIGEVKEELGEEEISNYPVDPNKEPEQSKVKTNQVKSNCFGKKYLYDIYETKFYLVNGKSIKGNPVLKDHVWE